MGEVLRLRNEITEKDREIKLLKSAIKLYSMTEHNLMEIIKELRSENESLKKV